MRRHGRIILLSRERSLAGQQLPHHPLLEEAGLVAPGFGSRDLGVHVGLEAAIVAMYEKELIVLRFYRKNGRHG